jgi:hypothetical protein
MRKLFSIGGLIAGVALVLFGVAAIYMGVDGRTTVRDSLSQEQIEILTRWVDGGIRRGNNPQSLPPLPRFTPEPAPPAPAVVVRDAMPLDQAILLDGVVPEHVIAGASARITAHLPNGRVEPLVWLHDYDDRYRHPFLFRRPIPLPQGTAIQGLPPGAALGLIAR